MRYKVTPYSSYYPGVLVEFCPLFGYYLTYTEYYGSQIISLQGQNGFSKYLTQLKTKEKIIARSKITDTEFYETICKFVKGEHIGY